MLGAFKSLFQAGKKSGSTQPGRDRLVFDHFPAVIYAVGDVHGCLAELKSLERNILDDSRGIEGEKWIVMLGDYIDRGPASANVLDHLLSAPPAGFQRICLAGNHEEAFLDFADSGCRDNGWLSFGGEETLASYGLYVGHEGRKELALKFATFVPREHLDFVRNLPEMVSLPGCCFVHAGIDPALPLEKQSSKTLLWSRPSQYDWATAELDFTVVHGHTPVRFPEQAGRRINVDIGAFASGSLAAVKMVAGQKVSYLFSN